MSDKPRIGSYAYGIRYPFRTSIYKIAAGWVITQGLIPQAFRRTHAEAITFATRRARNDARYPGQPTIRTQIPERQP